MRLEDGETTAVILGRWQPVHQGHRAALISICERFDRVMVGIGSSNVYDYRNPFHINEVEEMIHLVLRDFSNYSLVSVIDMPDDDAWCREVQHRFGEPDVFFTANPYVTHLLKNQFRLAHPATVIPDVRKVAVSATMVREALARGTDWRGLLPEAIAGYIQAHHLDERFRRDFGLHTLMMETIVVQPPDAASTIG